MSDIIASTYEIKEVIGSGGGGTVFLARHLRLDKDVVLKADKRKITTSPELLRREVDVLKGLRHTHIPQVYDYFVENDTVYTVIDYIQGESLDKPLKRGERFSQAQVIEWGKQLLDALVYLHSPTHGDPPKGFVHSDIKPANLMRLPNGDVCLIDFNIALAIGEENLVGLSAGYASPEHYGLDYSSVGLGSTSYASTDEETIKSAPTNINSDHAADRTEVIGPTELVVRNATAIPLSAKMETDPASAATELAGSGQAQGANEEAGLAKGTRSENNSGSDIKGGGRKRVVPDVRSDIYSLGATLYHLISGVRPAKDALEVVPLSEDEFSPLVVKIITKAMNPNPDLRYQTAAEMLADLQHLHQDDPRVHRLKRQAGVGGILILLCLVAGVFSAFVGLKRIQTLDSWAKLVEYSKNALADGDTTAAVDYALQALPEKKDIFTPPVTAAAQEALTTALGIYELEDTFQPHLTIDLPSEPLKMVASPSGTKVAAIYAYQVAVYDMETGAKLAELPVEPSVMSDVVFLDDSLLAFAGEDGLCVYDTDASSVLWRGGAATQLAASADGKKIAAVYKEDTSATIYDAATGDVLDTVSFDGRSQYVPVNDIFADPERDVLALNGDGSILAASFTDGSLSLFDLGESGSCMDLMQEGSYAYFRGGFCGEYFAFSADSPENSLMAVVDTENWKQTFGITALSKFLLQADETGIYVAAENMLVSIDPATGEQTGLASTEEAITAFTCGKDYTLAASGDQSYRFFDRGAEQLAAVQTEQSCDYLALSGTYAVVGSRDAHSLRLMKLESHTDQDVLVYDLTYDHYEARVSPQADTVMLFRQDRFRLYDMDGSILADVEIPDGEQVHDQQYIREGESSYLEVTYYDGMVRAWSGQDGALLWERQEEKPDTSADEVFFTDSLRIEAPLHETPVAYDLDTGKEVAELEADDYLIYVTQAGGYVITEYVTALGERYGLLMNDRCEVLARLPDLCDMVDDTLYFDCPSGHLRSSPIYGLDELREMGRAQNVGETEAIGKE